VVTTSAPGSEGREFDIGSGQVKDCKIDNSCFLDTRSEFNRHGRSLTWTGLRGGGIAYLNDPDSYAGWSFYAPVRATQARQVEG